MTEVHVISSATTGISSEYMHLILEALLAMALAVAVYFHFARKNSSTKSAEPEMPSLEEQQRRIAAFRSQMFRANTEPSVNTEASNRAGVLTVEARNGCYITIRNTSGDGCKEYLDLVTEDYHSFSTHPVIVDVAKRIVVAYGVGSCGPRGFYGTIKPHMVAEKDIANFLGVEDSLIVSFSFATISTLISCHAGRSDYLVVDDGVNLAVHEGCALSRAIVLQYNHNDMTHLEELLQEVATKEAKEKKLSRRFVVTEGIFKNLGDMCNLPRIMELCDKYKFRIVLDDSCGFGCMGPTGRGTHEHFGIPTSCIDLYVGSLSQSLGAVGGFCAGEHVVVDYQRLTASAYIFSASLAPFVTAGVSAGLKLLDEDQTIPKRLQRSASLFRSTIRNAKLNSDKIAMVECCDDVSPIVVLRPTESYVKCHQQRVEEELQEVVEAAKSKGVLITRHLYASDEKCSNFPALRAHVKGSATEEELLNAAGVIIEAVRSVFS
uniref:serine C-palmitoyltransferase n=1 Tax=Trypanosoma congolense (strain IL3000) TaxID=1068625 RepID=G0UKS4_TRYCI|nr:putative serine-palmitoyl-CoA transferase [Trypanosoma congolense IL3000]